MTTYFRRRENRIYGRLLAVFFVLVCILIALVNFKEGSRNVERVSLQVNHFSSRRQLENAVLFVLCRENDLKGILNSIHDVESRFNSKFSYPYVFLNNKHFSEHFKKTIKSAINPASNITFDIIDMNTEAWSYPPYVNQTKAREMRLKLMKQKVQYGSEEQYHFMCRYFSGYFYDHPALLPYDYYWRIEPNVNFMCNINFDPFRFLRENNKIYGYVILHTEIMATIPTLWKHTKAFMNTPFYTTTNTNNQSTTIKTSPSTSTSNNIPSFLQGMTSLSGEEYSGCHFWSNFEIASLTFFRSKQYREYFKYLDKTGGFFYERWGDAPVHTLALGLFARSDQIHQFERIAYTHAHFEYCPVKAYIDSKADCSCTPNARQQLSWGMCKIMSEFQRYYF
eukprot:gene4369-8695_t